MRHICMFLFLLHVCVCVLCSGVLQFFGPSYALRDAVIQRRTAMNPFITNCVECAILIKMLDYLQHIMTITEIQSVNM